MKTIYKYTTIPLLTFVLMFFVSCSQSGKAKQEENAESKTESKDSTAKETDIAELTAEQIKAVDVELGTIEQKNLTSVVKASGQLTVPPQNKAVVNALVGGVIRKINVVEGQAVKKGQIVVTIENPDFIRLQQDYLTSKDNLVYLEQEYERQKQLKEADAGIGKIYQQASANYAAEKSKLLTLEKQLQQIHVNPAQVSKGNLIAQIPVLAPISGTVGKVNLSIGTYTDVSSPIMEIINNSTIYCDLLVYEKDIAKVKVGQKINFALTNQNNKQVSGHVSGINKSFERENKAVVVHAVMNIASLSLIPGMYVSALIETGKQFVSALPIDAIVKSNDKQYIFVLSKEDKNEYQFKMIEVITGVSELGYIEITPVEKISENAKVVIKNPFFVLSKTKEGESGEEEH
jgi:cobalt-zinc-cadmium efflux system membrane fusion protein